MIFVFLAALAAIMIFQIVRRGGSLSRAGHTIQLLVVTIVLLGFLGVALLNWTQ
jgi:hypothetical protein